MDTPGRPETAFVDPAGDNAEAVKALAEDALDLLVDHLAAAADQSPLPTDPTVPPPGPPETPRNQESLLADLETIIGGSMNPANPGYIGHMDTMPTTVSMVGDLVAAAINNNMLSVEMSPVLSELEVRLVEELAAEFGFGSGAGGVLTSGGSVANLQALAVARNDALGFHAGGMTTVDCSPVVFASEVAHTSLQKAAMLLGLGTDGVVPVETDDDSRLRPAALEAAIERAEQDGRLPFCVVATAGTTTTGNIDPLAAVAEIASAHDLWFHVDAAYGGALVFSESERDRLRGIEAADSLTFNPQKWCYVAKTCAMALFSDADVLETAFRVGAPYMREDDTIPNLGEVSVQGTRQADILKLWMTLQHLGRVGLEELIDESYRLTAYLRERVRAREQLELASEPETNIVCFRADPAWCPAEKLDALNSRIQERLLTEHDVFVSLPEYRGSRWLRVVLLNPFTDERILDRLFDGIDTCLDAERP